MRSPRPPPIVYPGQTMVTCFTCGLPSTKEWAQKVATRPTGPKRPYFPFLVQITPPPGAVLEADGTTLVCAFCHASLLAQWRNFELQAAAATSTANNGSQNQSSQIRRVYSLGKFICGVCGVTTYRKRVRTLPVQEFPFLATQRPAGSLTFGNNLHAIVCLDCYETLRTQNEEYDRWGFPLQKRRFNWLARQPPDPNSPEAGVARLPCGKMKLPSCPPTEPLIKPPVLPDPRINQPSTPSGLSNKPQVNSTQQQQTQSAPSASTSASETDPMNRTRKVSVAYASNPFVDSKVHSSRVMDSPTGSPSSRPPYGSPPVQPNSQGGVPKVPIKSEEHVQRRGSGSPLGPPNHRPLVPVIPCEGMRGPRGHPGSPEYLSSSLPSGTVLVPAVIYHPRRKLSPSPHGGRRYSSAISLYPSTAPYHIPTSISAGTMESRHDSPLRMPYPQTSTSPWVPLQKLHLGGGSISVKRRRFSETVTQDGSTDLSSPRKYSDSRLCGPNNKTIEPLLMLAELNERSCSESNLQDMQNPVPSASTISHSLGSNPEDDSLTRKMERAVITEPDSTFREPMPAMMRRAYEDKSTPLRKRRTAFEYAESMEYTGPGGGESASSSPGPLIFELEPSDSGTYGGRNEGEDENCVIDLSLRSKRNSIYSSDPSVRDSVTGSSEYIRRNHSAGSLGALGAPRGESPSGRSSVIVERPRNDSQ